MHEQPMQPKKPEMKKNKNYTHTHIYIGNWKGSKTVKGLKTNVKAMYRYTIYYTK